MMFSLVCLLKMFVVLVLVLHLAQTDLILRNVFEFVRGRIPLCLHFVELV